MTWWLRRFGDFVLPWELFIGALQIRYQSFFIAEHLSVIFVINGATRKSEPPMPLPFANPRHAAAGKSSAFFRVLHDQRTGSRSAFPPIVDHKV